MNKETKTGMKWNASGSSSAGAQLQRNFSGDLDALSSSQRKFDGKANSTIDRKFADRMTVLVIGVMPNGNLIIEGTRQRILNREVRTLRVNGVVRPADIGAGNTVLSQYIGNFQVIYDGRGPDTNYTNQGWGGRLFNVLWPY
jgi:flagellar L-ring protein precursor FlgH